MQLKIKRLAHAEGLPLPSYQTVGAAGADICAAVAECIVLKAGERYAVPTGFCFEIPAGYELQIRGRSGLAFKHGISLVNGVGTIDADYTGEVSVLLINHGQEAFTIEPGMRIAQCILARAQQAQFLETDEIHSTARGQSGFGSTGSF